MKITIAALIIICGVVVLISMLPTANSPRAAAINASAVAAQPTRAARLETLNASRDASSKRAYQLCKKNDGWSIDDCVTVASKKIRIGMTADQVRAAWGKPDKINSTTSAFGDTQQWVYGESYVYVDNGVLRSIQQSKQP